MPHWNRVVVSCIIIATLVGCGSDTESTVSGTVTLDGVALDQGTVMFLPISRDGRAASGSIRIGGNYKIQTGQTGGLPAGEYRVQVVSRSPSKPNPQGGPPSPGKLLSPEHYGNANTSGLMFAVESGRNDIDLNLTTD